MHILAGTHLKEEPSQEEVSSSPTKKSKQYYPVKIVLPPNKSRVLFFESKEDMEMWKKVLQQAMGYSDMFEFYQMESTLGKGQFGLVKLATHKKTGLKMAVKTVKKKNMKAIEVF